MPPAPSPTTAMINRAALYGYRVKLAQHHAWRVDEPSWQRDIEHLLEAPFVLNPLAGEIVGLQPWYLDGSSPDLHRKLGGVMQVLAALGARRDERMATGEAVHTVRETVARGHSDDPL